MKHAEAAQHRATLSAYLSNNPGRHTTEAIAAATGLGARTAGQMLGAMARNGLIAPMGKKGSKKTWAWTDEVQQPTEEWMKVGEGKKPPPPKRSTATPAKEIELQLGGLLVIVGRNERTGRIRITLEDTSP